MVLPAASVAMAPDHALDVQFAPRVASSSPSSLYVEGSWEATPPVGVTGFLVQYHRVASSYTQASRLLPPGETGYAIQNLVADTYYKVCVKMHHNVTSLPTPLESCLTAATTSWQIPVSIGSSIGAVLALSIIVLIVLISRCPQLVRRPSQTGQPPDNGKYDSMSLHFAAEDRYELSDGTTPGNDDDVFSMSSDGESRWSAKQLHQLQQQPQSLADRLCNGSGVRKPPARSRTSLGQIGRARSFIEQPVTAMQYCSATKGRRGRLTHANIHFQSIQSEPGNTLPGGKDLVVSVSRDSSFPKSKQSQSDTSFCNSSGTMLSSKPDSSRDSLGFGIFNKQSGVGSDPTLINSAQREKAANTKQLPDQSQTIHMSFENDIESDTYV